MATISLTWGFLTGRIPRLYGHRWPGAQSYRWSLVPLTTFFSKADVSLQRSSNAHGLNLNQILQCSKTNDCCSIHDVGDDQMLGYGIAPNLLLRKWTLKVEPVVERSKLLGYKIIILFDQNHSNKLVLMGIRRNSLSSPWWRGLCWFVWYNR